MPAPSTIPCTCPHCSGRVVLKDPGLIGKRIRCPKCKEPFRVEAPGSAAATPVRTKAPATVPAAGRKTRPRPDDEQAPPLRKKKARVERDEDNEDDEEEERPARKKKKKKKKKANNMPLILAGGGAVAVIAVVVVLVVIMNQGTSSPTAQNTNTNQKNNQGTPPGVPGGGGDGGVGIKVDDEAGPTGNPVQAYENAVPSSGDTFYANIVIGFPFKTGEILVARAKMGDKGMGGFPQLVAKDFYRVKLGMTLGAKPNWQKHLTETNWGRHFLSPSATVMILDHFYVNKTATIWNPLDRKKLGEFPVIDTLNVVFTPDGSHFATEESTKDTEGRKAKLYHVRDQTGNSKASFTVQTDDYPNHSLSADSNTLVVTVPNHPQKPFLKVFNVSTREETDIPLPWQSVAGVLAMPDGKSVFLAHGAEESSPIVSKQSIFSLEEKQVIKELQHRPVSIHVKVIHTQLSADGKVALFEGVNSALFWNTDTGKLITEIPFPKEEDNFNGRRRDSVLSPTGAYYAVPYKSGSLYVWRL